MTPIMAVTQTPPFIERAVDLHAWLGKKSHFRFGPHQTGKTWIRRALPQGRVYELLDSAVYLALGQPAPEPPHAPQGYAASACC